MKYMLIIVSICTLTFSCQSNSWDPSEYMEFVHSTEYNGRLMFENLSGTVLYKTATFMNLSATPRSSWQKDRFLSAVTNYSDLLYFELTLKEDRNDKKAAVLDEMAHYQQEKKIENGIFLILNSDTLMPAIFQPERYYGLKDDRYMIGFERPDDVIAKIIFAYRVRDIQNLVEFDVDILREPQINW